jgi:hypothetical protein
MTTEQIFTQAVSHRERLTGFLREYRESQTKLIEAEAKCASAKADEQSSLNDDESEETELFRRVSGAQVRFQVYSNRLVNEQARVSEALRRVESAFPFAEGELRGACGELLTIRRAIVKARILEAIGLPENPVLLRGLADLIEVSALVRSVKDCQPGLNVFSGRSIEAKTEELLAKFERLAAEKGKSL